MRTGSVICAVSYIKVGDVQVQQGDLQAALQSYSDSHAIFDRLVKSDPGNAGWQRDLSVSLGKLALVHWHSGDKAKASAFLQQGQAIMARLTKLSPDNVVWKKDLEWFDRRSKSWTIAPVIARHRPGHRNTHDKSLDARLNPRT